MILELSQYREGDRVMYRGAMAEVIAMGIYDRDAPGEHYEYAVELETGEKVERLRDSEIEPYQRGLF